MFKLLIFLLVISSFTQAAEFIVKIDPDTSIEEFKDFTEGATFESLWGGDINDEDLFKNPIIIRTDKIKESPIILDVQKNFIYKVQFPDDPKIEGHWALDNESVKKVWSEVNDCQRTLVAVLDTGVNFNHEDLRDTFWQKRECRQINGEIKESCIHGHNFVNENKAPIDFNGHGTYMASLIGAIGDNSRGISGLCQKSQIMAIKVLDNFGEGSTIEIVRGIRFAVDNGAKILNLSFGRFGLEDTLLKEELIRASKRGVLIVTPAGNYGEDLEKNDFYPCSYNIKGLLCVASIDENSELSRISNFGSEVVDLVAPGVDILGAGIGEIVEDEIDFEIFGRDWKVLGAEDSCLETPSPTLVYPANFCEVEMDDFKLPKLEWPSDKFSLMEFKTNRKDEITKIDLTDCEENCLISIGERGPLALWDMKLLTIHPSNNQYKKRSGTSVSAGYVSGVAALIWSYNKKFSSMDVKKTLTIGGRKFEHLVGAVKEGVSIWPSDNLIYIKRPEGIKVQISP
jgi:subtilisin family serine protease